MGKKIAVFLISILFCINLSACAEAESVAGTTWLLTDASFGGTAYTKEELQALYGEYTYSFEDNGIVSITVLEHTSQGTYLQKGQKIEISHAGQNFTAAVNGNRMTMEYLGFSFTFAKQ